MGGDTAEEEEEEETTAPGEGEPGRGEGPSREEPQALPPQWDRALVEGTGWEEGLGGDVSGVKAGEKRGEGAAAAAAAAAASSGVNANPVRQGQLSEACAGAEGGAPGVGEGGEDNGQDATSHDGSGSTVPSKTPTAEVMESIHRWLQVRRRSMACGVNAEICRASLKMMADDVVDTTC